MAKSLLVVDRADVAMPSEPVALARAWRDRMHQSPVDPLDVDEALREAGVRVLSLGVLFGPAPGTDAVDSACRAGSDVAAGAVIVTFRISGCTPQRMRWAKAREFGHIVLGHLEHPHEGYRVEQQRDADAFAAQLLMPEEGVRMLAASADEAEMARLVSETYNVECRAAARRLEELGIQDYATAMATFDVSAKEHPAKRPLAGLLGVGVLPMWAALLGGTFLQSWHH